MREIVAMAFKDLRILLRDRSGFFFTLVWPLLIAVFFGVMFGGNRGREQASAIDIAVVDEDNTAGSREFIEALDAGGEFAITILDREQAFAAVKGREAVAYVVLKPGFGEASMRVFWGEPPEVEVGIDPSRSAAASMVEGIMMKYASRRMGQALSDQDMQRNNIRSARETLAEDEGVPPEIRMNLSRLFADLDRFMDEEAAYTDSSGTTPSSMGGLEPIRVERVDVAGAVYQGPRSAYAITFPQGVIWGLIGTAAGFAVSIVVERTRGTLFRLQTAPISRTSVLGGKALACFISILLMSAVLYTLAFFIFGLRPVSFPMLGLAVVSSAVGFVGLMMLLAVSGKTEQAVGGIGWAVLIVMSMVGGGMIPLFFMPSWMRTISTFSPVKWSVLAMEGAVWRGFSFLEMLKPCGILVGVGVICFTIGVRVFDWTTRTD
jgi:ABC-2 type transport system permease protein